MKNIHQISMFLKYPIKLSHYNHFCDIPLNYPMKNIPAVSCFSSNFTSPEDPTRLICGCAADDTCYVLPFFHNGRFCPKKIKDTSRWVRIPWDLTEPPGKFNMEIAILLGISPIDWQFSRESTSWYPIYVWTNPTDRDRSDQADDSKNLEQLMRRGLLPVPMDIRWCIGVMICHDHMWYGQNLDCTAVGGWLSCHFPWEFLRIFLLPSTFGLHVAGGPSQAMSLARARARWPPGDSSAQFFFSGPE